MAQATDIPATEATLPPRPPTYPRLVPGQIQYLRIATSVFVVVEFILQLVRAKTEHRWDGTGLSFLTTGLLLNLHLLLSAVLVRRRKKTIPGYEAREHRIAWILFFDLAAAAGTFIWAALKIAFMYNNSPTGVEFAYIIFLMLFGVCHIKLTIDDCRFVHYKRRHQKWVNKEFSRQNNGSMY